MIHTTGTSNFQPEDVQSLVYLGGREHKNSVYLLYRFRQGQVAQVKNWLAIHLEEINSLEKEVGDFIINVAFTKSGIAKLGCSEKELSTFSIPFQQGMWERKNVLGDHEGSCPDLWEWGNGEKQIDMLVILMAKNEDQLKLKMQQISLDAAVVEECHQIDSYFSSHEHFGFRDGITEITTEGFMQHYASLKKAKGEQQSWQPPKDQVLKDGEVLLRHLNEYGEMARGPVVKDGKGILPEILDPLFPSLHGDLGRNGTYLVFRQLEQNVSAFWKFVLAQSDAIKDPVYNCTYVASKLIGRLPDGKSFYNSEEISGFLDHNDRDGLLCPIASHIRRSNPRDTLYEKDPVKSKQIVRNHQIVRRARLYGPLIHPVEDIEKYMQNCINQADASDKRGINFLCFNADISQQFEFIQSNWINNPKFLGLYNDPDPIAASHKPREKYFSIPEEPFRKRLKMDQNFVTVKGGAYFFMPGIKALKYLAQL